MSNFNVSDLVKSSRTELVAQIGNVISEASSLSPGEKFENLADATENIFQLITNNTSVKVRFYDRHDVEYMISIDSYGKVARTPSIMWFRVIIPEKVDCLFNPVAILRMIMDQYNNVSFMTETDDDGLPIFGSSDFVYHVETEELNEDDPEDEGLAYILHIDYNYHKIEGKMLELHYDEFHKTSSDKLARRIEKEGYTSKNVPLPPDSDDSYSEYSYDSDQDEK